MPVYDSGTKEKSMSVDHKDCLRLIKRLVSIIEGAPYPTNVEPELYSIWHDHAMEHVTDALEYIDTMEGRPEAPDDTAL
jgi:hypothetical protein